MRARTLAMASLLAMSVATFIGYGLAPAPPGVAPSVPQSVAEPAELDGNAYRAEVEADLPVAYYRLAEQSRPIFAQDQMPEDVRPRGGPIGSATFEGAFESGVPSPFPATTATAFTNGALRIEHLERFRAAEAYSVEAWIRATRIDTLHRGIFSSERPGHFGARMYVFTSDGTSQIRFGNANGLGSADVTAAFPNDSDFHHVAGTFDGRFVCVYVDGSSECRTVAGSRDTAAPTVLIGRRAESDEPFVGAIADVALYDRPLSAARIRAHVDAARG